LLGWCGKTGVVLGEVWIWHTDNWHGNSWSIHIPSS
jgi:hypothetical protein